MCNLWNKHLTVLIQFMCSVNFKQFFGQRRNSYACDRLLKHFSRSTSLCFKPVRFRASGVYEIVDFIKSITLRNVVVLFNFKVLANEIGMFEVLVCSLLTVESPISELEGTEEISCKWENSANKSVR